jgi:uncharacterized UBP type Zn finger protein
VAKVRCARTHTLTWRCPGHGLEYYKQTGYPLAVKLGTVQADANAIDVYSYAEDGMVTDPHVRAHVTVVSVTSCGS